MVDAEEMVYFRDVYDHIIRLTDELDTYRELASATLDVYLTQVNNNLSVIMKRLTGVTVILAGVGAIAGIFGMSEAAAAIGGVERGGFWLVSLITIGLAAGAAVFLPDRLDPQGRSRVRRLNVEASRRAASSGVSSTRSADARTSSGIPCGPVTATAGAIDLAGVPGAPQDAEAVGIAAVVAEGDHAGGPGSRSGRSDASRFCHRRHAAGGRRQPAAMVGQVVRRARGRPGSMAASTAARAAARSVPPAERERRPTGLSVRRRARQGGP